MGERPLSDLDPEQLRQLLSIAEEAEARSPAEEPVPKGVVRVDRAAQRLGTWIDQYRVVRYLGEGGMAVVYLAEQEYPVQRKVALKLIKPGMDSKRVIVRFEMERQALALLNHPNIARIIDAGTTEAGRPYFVMEYVEGEPITEYCDRNKLSIDERLACFRQVCDAISHAHQKGIIHRDIKPSNILVSIQDGLPIAKVIDFGVARAMGGELAAHTMLTEEGRLIGTPEYMSPEQADLGNENIDVRSDVYSLGVLLYVLLAGVLPFDTKRLHEGGLDTVRRLIKEEDPRTPSTRLTSLGEEAQDIAANRGTEVQTLTRRLRQELEWIPLKAMAKERERRYRSVAELADDIQNYLHRVPLMAGPPTTLYRIQKLVRRNQVMVAAATVVAIVLVLGSLVSTWEAIRARQAQREQGRLRQQAQAEELTARRNAYAADMSLAQQALEASNLGRAVDLLNRHRPRPGEQDLRGWEWRYLWQFCQSDAEFTLCRFPQAVRSIGVSPDGKRLALCGHHGMTRLWDIAARKEVASIQEGGPGMPGALVFSPGGDLLAISADKGVVRLWDVEARTDRAQLQCPDYAKPLEFSADGTRLATLAAMKKNSECEVALWDVAAARLISKFTAKGQIELWQGGNTLSSGSGFVAIGWGDGRIGLCEAETGRELLPPIAGAHPGNVTALALSPDESLLASGGGDPDATIKLWEVKSGNQVACLAGHTGLLSSLAFSPDGKTLASASWDQTIRLWDVDKRQPITVLRGHRSEVLAVAFLPDGKTLVSGDVDGEVCFWSTRPKPRQESFVMRSISYLSASLRLRGRNAAFSMDSQSFVTLDRNGEVLRWDTATVQPLGELTALGANNNTMLFSPDGRLLVVVDNAGVIKVWDWVGQRLLRSFVGHRMEAGPSEPSPWVFTSDGKTLVSGDRSGTVKLWDVASWQATAAWEMMHTLAWSAALSLDGRTLFTGHEDGIVAVTDLVTGQELAATEAHMGNVSGLALSPDGTLVASSSTEGLVVLWDVATRRQVARIGNFQLGAHSVSFSPDGRRLAIGKSEKEVVTVLDITTRREVLTLAGQGHYFCDVRFSPDGNSLMAISDEGNLHLWRAPSFAEIDAIEKGKITDP